MAPEGKHQQTHGPHTWQVHAERDCRPTQLYCFSNQRGPPTEGMSGLYGHSSSKSGKPSKGRKQKGSRGRVGIQATGPQPCLEPQFPEMDNAPHIWLGWAAPALGRQPSYTPVFKRWRTSSNHAGVTCPPCLPDARQEQQTAPTGMPMRPQITVQGNFSGSKVN